MPCGECVACCTASQFIAISPGEAKTLTVIEPSLLLVPPNAAKGTVVLGYDSTGRCPMLVGKSCRIYQDRPVTCRQYDCRIFAAAGLQPEGPHQAQIRERVTRWQFRYADRLSRTEHLATRTAAQFIRENRDLFPGKRIPEKNVELAVLAIKVFDLFMPYCDSESLDIPASSRASIASAIVTSAREFEQSRETRS